MTERIATTWPEIEHRLARNPSYWVATTRPDGRPHVAPVWGVWTHRRLWFSTSPESVKARNLAADPRVAVHVDNADDVVILEGTVEVVRDRAVLAPVDAAYAAKYVLPRTGEPCHLVDPSAEPFVLAVAPRVGYSWLEQVFTETMTRWRFEGDGTPRPEEMSYW